LLKLGAIGCNDLAAMGLVVFPAYLAVVRKIQKLYWLEPAGSHGVWSLDDYQFLVFLFGAAQLARK
jgi:serine/threonine-protein phosphatase 2A activator